MAGAAGRARSFTALLLAGAGILVSLPLAEQTLTRDPREGTLPALTRPVFDARLRQGVLTVAGQTASPAHERAIRAALAQTPARTKLAAGVLLPEYWHAATLALLAAVRALDAGSGSMAPGGIALRGVTTAPARFEARLDALRAALPDAVDLRDETIRISSSESLAALCTRTFVELAHAPIEFELSSAALRPSAHAHLDKLAEFAFDCPDQRIRITGHTDASGEAAWNRELSRQRADAVAGYLVRRGVPAGRLVVAAMGATDPVADNATELGRRMNRRIEFGLEQRQSLAGSARLSAE